MIVKESRLGEDWMSSLMSIFSAQKAPPPPPPPPQTPAWIWPTVVGGGLVMAAITVTLLMRRPR